MERKEFEGLFEEKNGRFERKDPDREQPVSGMNFESQIIRGIDFSNMVFDGVRFGASKISDVSFHNCIFKNCGFETAHMDGVRMDGVRFEDCALGYMRMEYGDLKDVSFAGCRGDHVRIKDSRGESVSFEKDCALPRMMLYRCGFDDFYGSGDLSDLDVKESALRGRFGGGRDGNGHDPVDLHLAMFSFSQLKAMPGVNGVFYEGMKDDGMRVMECDYRANGGRLWGQDQWKSLRDYRFDNRMRQMAEERKTYAVDVAKHGFPARDEYADDYFDGPLRGAPEEVFGSDAAKALAAAEAMEGLDASDAELDY